MLRRIGYVNHNYRGSICHLQCKSYEGGFLWRVGMAPCQCRRLSELWCKRWIHRKLSHLMTWSCIFGVLGDVFPSLLMFQSISFSCFSFLFLCLPPSLHISSLLCHFDLMTSISASVLLKGLSLFSLSLSPSFYPPSTLCLSILLLFLSPPSLSLCGCSKSIKDARGLNHFDIITWAWLTQTNPEPMSSLHLCRLRKALLGREMQRGSKTWPNARYFNAYQTLTVMRLYSKPTK